ncbi:hypothetical protein EDB19DRAFT_1632566 [Suillus lakei]|nr:hypothetical protein EDB19DRAFT_1632566 [Suillus lakei]
MAVAPDAHRPLTELCLYSLTYTLPPFKAVYVDYIVYEQHRHEFMNQPHARATLLHGGLIWRLVHSFGFDDLPSILEGISWEAVPFGLMLPINDQTYFDDELSEEEVDFMCGTYYSYNDDGTMDKVSWWPRPQAWAASGLNVGFWSMQCEEWFQKRLNNIQEGVSRVRNTCVNDDNGPMTTTQWRRSLKFNVGTNKMMKNIDAACSQFLANTTGENDFVVITCASLIELLLSFCRELVLYHCICDCYVRLEIIVVV